MICKKREEEKLARKDRKGREKEKWNGKNAGLQEGRREGKNKQW